MSADITVTLVAVAILTIGAAVVVDATNGQLAIPAFAVVVLVPALLAVRSPRVPSLLARVLAVAVGTAVGMTAYFAFLYRCQTGGYISFCDWTSNALGVVLITAIVSVASLIACAVGAAIGRRAGA